MIPTLDFREAAVRLLVAAAIGAVIGLNRELRRKPAGLRTHALASLGAALLMELALLLPAGDLVAVAGSTSRVMQGTITGIGFLGAGVIMRTTDQEHVHGLTTAASIWLAAAFGMGAGIGQWMPVVIAAALALVILILGILAERASHRVFGRWSGPPPA